MQLFFAPELNDQSKNFAFDKEESKHIVKVLRKKEGDILHITNGKGLFFSAEISMALEKKCEVTILSIDQQKAKDFYIHLAVAPTKMNERYEWFLEKATEIGIDEITPIFCEHSERKVIKNERFEKIILSAVKQSNQSFVPVLNEGILLKDFLNQTHTGELFIAHCDDLHKTPLKNSFSPKQKYTLLIEPEGDFSPKEIALALEKGFKPVTLGATRLRTETAAIVACHSFVYGNEEL
ncbi:16S rRNA (uracil(1498)-N(3))-methyltransferase [Capnocytophaga sp. ARDL2]|uniref:16S rRNA (uracil(1498)-N(3))-methyltransferase n=1 Tax=Capnocytophaga sp. ARDL2 TaxID=3238809 RepID=UPI003556C30F